MPNEGQKNVGKKKVLPGLEPGLQGSEPWVLTNYTIEPLMRNVGRGKKKAPRVRLELTTYRLTAGRAADCAIQDFDAERLLTMSVQTQASILDYRVSFVWIARESFMTWGCSSNGRAHA